MLSQAVSSAFRHLCEDFDTPRSLMAWMLYQHGEHLQFSQMEIRPEHYLERDFQKFKNDYLVTEYLSKYKGLSTGVSTEEVAYASFTAGEDQCRAANERVRSLLNGNGSCPWLRVISLAQAKIQACIGTHPKFAKLLDRFRWGSGATSSLKGDDARLDFKLREEQLTVTTKALPYLRAAMATDYAWLRARGLETAGPTSLCRSEFRVVRGSRGLTVPKNAKTDRFIAAEPTGNIFLQLGVGAHIRQCLHRVGINLDDQSINQELARTALDLGLATVDLKAASDTIASALVWQLLPYSWASFLWDLRSPEIQIKGRWHVLEKFSSMGNGFTFELESLIFWSLTEALRDVTGEVGRVSVYGDDIVCPREMVPTLQELLGWCGFTLNSKKSHHTGLFRESCGNHFFGGKDVTPIYQKDTVKELFEAYRLHNRLFYHAIDRGSITGPGLALADRSLLRAVRASRLAVEWERSRQVEKQRRLRVKWDVFHELPVQGDKLFRTLDGGLLTTGTSLRTAVYQTSKTGWGGFRCKNLVFVPDASPVDEGAFYAVSLRSGAACKPGILENLPFDGESNLRDRGLWRSRDRLHPEACDVHWI